MDRSYSSSSSSTATETAKKAVINNAMRSRNGLSMDSTTVSPSHRKSFPSTSDIGSSFNGTNQVTISFFSNDNSNWVACLLAARMIVVGVSRSITSPNLTFHVRSDCFYPSLSSNSFHSICSMSRGLKPGKHQQPLRFFEQKTRNWNF